MREEPTNKIRTIPQEFIRVWKKEIGVGTGLLLPILTTIVISILVSCHCSSLGLTQQADFYPRIDINCIVFRCCNFIY